MRAAHIKRLVGGLVVALAVAVTGYLLIRPWHLRWGATTGEVAQAMPGDLAGARWTRAITVNTPPDRIWPWLVQWGQGRGGWYSYDWLENLLGFDIHTADRIMPEFQQLAVGDPICMARGVCPSHVSLVEPNRWLSWQATGDDGSPTWTFTFGLFPLDGERTRLVVRESFAPDAMPPAVLAAIEIPDVVMEQKALQTVKYRAEGVAAPAYTTPVEIGAWLSAFVLGSLAGLLFVTRRNWRRPLAVGVMAVVVLLVLTFMFPPLWLRVALDIGLLLALLWSARPARVVGAATRPSVGLSRL
jgi:hypothetical protein